jgi:hypothetical protein
MLNFSSKKRQNLIVEIRRKIFKAQDHTIEYVFSYMLWVVLHATTNHWL